jgi:hypothetical protein
VEHGGIDPLGEANERLGIGDTLAADAAERPVDEAPPDFALALTLGELAAYSKLSVRQ